MGLVPATMPTMMLQPDLDRRATTYCAFARFTQRKTLNAVGIVDIGVWCRGVSGQSVGNIESEPMTSLSGAGAVTKFQWSDTTFGLEPFN